jgi:hypothetical protein
MGKHEAYLPISFPRHVFVSAWLLSLAACGPIGKLTAVAVTAGETCTNGVCGTPWLDPVRIEVQGEGVCGEFKIDFGYGGFPITEKNVDFSKGPKVYSQIYFSNGWPGPKTITAEGVTTCLGTVKTQHRVFTAPNSTRENYTVGFASPTQMCYAVPHVTPLPALRKNTKVTVTASPNPKVNFGCSFNGCIHDADGKPGSVAPAGFSFPGLRQYSLVLVVGNQIVQGGLSTNFVTTGSGELLLCVNDDLLYDNGGGWSLDISVDERNAAN